MQYVINTGSQKYICCVKFCNMNELETMSVITIFMTLKSILNVISHICYKR